MICIGNVLEDGTVTDVRRLKDGTVSEVSLKIIFPWNLEGNVNFWVCRRLKTRKFNFTKIMFKVDIGVYLPWIITILNFYFCQYILKCFKKSKVKIGFSISRWTTITRPGLRMGIYSWSTIKPIGGIFTKLMFKPVFFKNYKEESVLIFQGKRPTFTRWKETLDTRSGNSGWGLLPSTIRRWQVKLNFLKLLLCKKN